MEESECCGAERWYETDQRNNRNYYRICSECKEHSEFN